MDEKEIVRLYTEERKSLRAIAKVFNSNHHTIRRALARHGVSVDTEWRGPEQLTEEHKRKIGLASKGRGAWNRGKKAPRLLLYKNMRAHLRFDVKLEWLLQFDDVEKLKFLNKVVTKRIGKHFTVELYQAFIERFYNDVQFNTIYANWLENNEEKYFKPSLDHIIPTSKGGSYSDLNNFRFLTWFENRCKNDMSQQEWDGMKSRIGDYFL